MRDWWWCLLWALLSAAWCVSAGMELSATFDEPLYITRGLERWRSGSLDGLLRIGTMPLPLEVQTLPLAVAERWRGAPFDVPSELDRLLPWARAMNLPFWFLLLAYAYRVGVSCAGAWGGRLAVALLACEPSLLAHASLATTDIAVTACVVALCFHFAAGRDARWPQRLGLPALWYGAAVLAKASALIIGPFCLVVIEITRRRSLARAAVRDLAWIIAGGLLLVFLYCGSEWRPEPSFVAWARALPADPWLGPSMIWLSEHLRIFPNAGDGLVRQIRHNLRGHGSYLLGIEHARALWWYFPVLLTIKVTESALLLPLGAALTQRRTLVNWPLLSAVALIAYSLAFRVQLGIRMVLPLVALWIIGATVALARSRDGALLPLKKGGREGFMKWIIEQIPLESPFSKGGSGNDGSRRWSLTVVAVMAVAWSAYSAVSVWPNGLSYVNRLWGGTREGYRLVSDSNYDWGQGLNDLLAWQRTHGVAEIALWYFGTDPRAQHPPFDLVALHTLPTGAPEEVAGLVRGKLLAAGTTLVYGTSMSPSHARAAAFLRAREPVARTATFLIYDVGAADSGPKR